MSDPASPRPGEIAWADLTVPNAAEVRDFYRAVAGWSVDELSMGDYSDFVMRVPGTGASVAGVCHARGANAGLPAQWLLYIAVEDLDLSITSCRALGGEVIAGPTAMGAQGSFCVVRDPAGAVAALFQPPRAVP